VRHAILGAGGVGGLVAAVLAQDGRDVVLLLRPETLEVYPGGLHLESGVLGDIEVDVPASARLSRAVDVLWVTVKATQLEDAIKIAAPAVAGNAIVVPLLNGIDHVGRLREVYGDVVIAGSIKVETERVGPGHVVQTSPFASLELGPPPEPRELRERAGALAEELRSSGLNCALGDGEAEVLWGKLAVLAPFALATSSIRQPAGVVRQDAATCQLMLEAASEVCAVAATQGVALDARALQSALLGMPAGMRSSMQKDLAAGRPLELAAISGPILRIGRERGIPTPATAELVNRVAANQAL
jgi:2-dehydropantoate 2-reductase